MEQVRYNYLGIMEYYEIKEIIWRKAFDESILGDQSSMEEVKLLGCLTDEIRPGLAKWKKISLMK